METLAKNRRNTLLVRLLLFGLLAVGAATTIVAKTHRELAGLGQDELRKCELQQKLDVQKLEVEITQLTNELRLLREQIDACENQEGGDDPELAQLQKDLFEEDLDLQEEERKKEALREQIADCQASIGK
ncbi:MAG: hypothetical protein AAF828_00665 [Bacteroidota bacterium]